MTENDHTPDSRTEKQPGIGFTLPDDGSITHNSVQYVRSERTPAGSANQPHDGNEAYVGVIGIDIHGLETPGSLVDRVVRVLPRSDGLWLITGNRETALRVMDVLKHPVDRGTKQGARLYRVPEPVRTDSGGMVIHPASDEPASWLVTTDGRLRLVVDGQTVATVPAEEFDALETVDLPRVTESATEVGTVVWEVTDAAGDTLATYRERQHLFNDWQRVQKPLVPTRLTYVDVVRVYYPRVDSAGLTPCRLLTSHSDKVSRFYKDSLRTFLTLYTVQRQDSSVRVSTVRNWWQVWHDAQASGSPPGDEQFRRALPATLDVYDDGDECWIRDFTWAYPCISRG